MAKASVTYRAPAGDNKVCEMGGVTFFDGQATAINSDDHPVLMKKLVANPHFEYEADGEDSAAEAEDEADELDGMKVAELRALADDMGLDHEGMNKAELRDTIRAAREKAASS